MLTTENENRLKRAESRLDQVETAIRTVGHLVDTVQKTKGAANRAGRGLRVANLVLIGGSAVAITLFLLAWRRD